MNITAYATDEAAAIRIERARIKALEQALAARTQTLIVDHLDALTVREVAALVDLSPQRIGQLRPGHRPRGRRTGRVAAPVKVSPAGERTYATLLRIAGETGSDTVKVYYGAPGVNRACLKMLRRAGLITLTFTDGHESYPETATIVRNEKTTAEIIERMRP